MSFKPTHKITFTPQGGQPEVTEVMLTPIDGSLKHHSDSHLAGPAYTEQEWDQCGEPDWSLDNGEWTCQGKATPGGMNGTVEVVRL